MHVREIPGLVFDRMALEKQTVNSRDYGRANFDGDSIIGRKFAERPNRHLTVGQTIEDFWLLVDVQPDSTGLLAYESLKAIMHDYELWDYRGALIAGNRETGTWAAGRGEQHEQTVTLISRGSTYHGAEQLEAAWKTLAVVASMALHARDLLLNLPFETSIYFESDIDPNP